MAKKVPKKDAAEKHGSELRPPESANSEAVNPYKLKRKGTLSPQQYLEGILKGNRTILSQAITLIESSLPEHADLGEKLIESCLPYTGNSVRVGITGVPGVGKSTFIEALGLHVVHQGCKLAVLAVDPSSSISKGSILGDKTRMEQLSVHDQVYIRPSPSGGSLGGVARKTRETVLLCEAAGYNAVFIETVGVGQSETAVHSMVDFFLLLLLTGAGDELQGIKRGIMEMADAVVITKADGNNLQKAKQARTDFARVLHLFPPHVSGWMPQAGICSALTGEGIENTWQMIQSYCNHTRLNQYFFKKRQEQSKYWMYETINNALQVSFYNSPFMRKALSAIEAELMDNKISSFAAASRLLNLYKSQK